MAVVLQGSIDGSGSRSAPRSPSDGSEGQRPSARRRTVRDKVTWTSFSPFSASLLLCSEDGMCYPRVILIGGAPMAGKTTVAHLLAAHLGYGCLSTDDLGEAIRAVTTKDSHPALHPMAGYDYREYYVTCSLEALIADVRREHHALWP